METTEENNINSQPELKQININRRCKRGLGADEPLAHPVAGAKWWKSKIFTTLTMDELMVFNTCLSHNYIIIIIDNISDDPKTEAIH